MHRIVSVFAVLTLFCTPAAAGVSCLAWADDASKQAAKYLQGAYYCKPLTGHTPIARAQQAVRDLFSTIGHSASDTEAEFLRADAYAQEYASRRDIWRDVRRRAGRLVVKPEHIRSACRDELAAIRSAYDAALSRLRVDRCHLSVTRDAVRKRFPGI